MPSSKRCAEITTVAPDLLAQWVQHRLRSPERRQEPRLTEVFQSILWAVNEYVPAECGSVCLGGFPDSPNELVYVASFGESSSLIPGTRLPVEQGITGRVYRLGRPQLRNDVTQDRNFFRGVDRLTQFVTRSILAVPIVYEGEVCGVISLINRLDKRGFRRQDMRLMEVFCGYVSTSIRNLVDASFHREMAQRDYLTGLRNDRFFYTQLQHELDDCEAQGNDLSLIFMDLDRFKAVVDTYRHLVGSQVLAEVGQLLAQIVDHPGATLARYGGDEYVMVLPRANSETALALAERVRRAIVDNTFLTETSGDGRPPLNLRGQFSASIGVASYKECHFPPQNEFSPQQRRQYFIRIADEAMYQAKALGKNQVYLGRSIGSS